MTSKEIVTDEDRQVWRANRIADICNRLRELNFTNYGAFWDEMDYLVSELVNSADILDEHQWPADMPLGDMMRKHIKSWIEEVNTDG